METIVMLLVISAIAAIPASIAHYSKGRSFARWYVFGWFLWLPALIASLFVEARKPCPACSSSIPKKANICVYCGADVREATAKAALVKTATTAQAAPVVSDPVPHTDPPVDELKALEELKALADLKQEGVVTEEEFEAKKAELLTRV